MYKEQVSMLCTACKERIEEIAEDLPVQRVNYTESSPS
jgi:hypothetical protein